MCIPSVHKRLEITDSRQKYVQHTVGKHSVLGAGVSGASTVGTGAYRPDGEASKKTMVRMDCGVSAPPQAGIGAWGCLPTMPQLLGACEGGKSAR